MAKYTIREAGQDDIAGITRLRHTIKEFRYIEADEYRSFWNSQINTNPYSIRYAYVGVNEKDEIVAHIAMVPFKFLKEGEPLCGGSLCQLMVHEDFRRQLLYPQLEMKILSGYKGLGIDFSFGLANRDEVKKAHISFGFREFGDLVVYAVPYKLARMVRRFIKNDLLYTAITPFLYMTEIFLRLTRYPGKRGLGTAEISRFDSEIDQLLEEVQRHFPYSALRNSSILNWRFTSSPEVKYHILVTKENEKVIGYAVLRRVDIKGFDVLAIVDILFSPDRIDAGKSLINSVHRKAVQLNVDMSACLLNPYDPLCRVIRKCGFFKTPETFSLIVHEPRGTTPRFSKDSFAKWHLTWFDHDAL